MPPSACINDPAVYVNDADGVFTPLNDWEERFHADYCQSLTTETECERAICGNSYINPSYAGARTTTNTKCACGSPRQTRASSIREAVSTENRV